MTSLEQACIKAFAQVKCNARESSSNLDLHAQLSLSMLNEVTLTSLPKPSKLGGVNSLVWVNSVMHTGPGACFEGVFINPR